MLLTDIVPILHDSLLNHMRIITKVGASYIDRIVPEVNSFFLANVSRLSPPPIFEEKAEERGGKDT